MLRSLRLPVALAVLALAAPAWADSADAPGLQKKQPAPTASVPVQAPGTDTTAAPAPPVQDPQTTADVSPAPKAKTHGNVPVNKGTLKKVVATTPAATPVTTQVAPPKARTPHRHRARTLHLRTQATSSRHQAGGAHHRAAPAVASTPASTPAPVPAATVAPRPVHRSHRHHRTPGTSNKATKATLDPISRAANQIVEVVPGPVMLAMAGLVTLVFLLVIRSLGAARRGTRELRRSYAITVEALATAVEAKDHTTGGHIERVRRLGLLLAKEIVPREARDPQMAYGFLLHDIGKLAIPDAILQAPGRLTEEQWALMRRHPEEGVRMLSHVPFLDRALDVVLYHHERWDGGGYPEGLEGRQIPLWARIFSVVDTLDAMTADRPYRAGRSYAEALAEIKRLAGTQFDPKVVAALERIPASEIEPLLEPTQQLPPGYEPLEELPLPAVPLVTA